MDQDVAVCVRDASLLHSRHGFLGKRRYVTSQKTAVKETIETQNAKKIILSFDSSSYPATKATDLEKVYILVGLNQRKLV